MRIKKIRRQHKRHKAIEDWAQRSAQLDLEHLQQSHRDYVKIWVHPWSGISMVNSRFPEPRGKTKKLMLQGLFHIYENWKKELNKLGKDYYLKIWLYEPRFSESQVVCAIDQQVDFYHKTFEPCPKREKLKVHYGSLQKQVDEFQWTCALDQDSYLESDLKHPPEVYGKYSDWLYDQRFLRKLKKGNYRSYEIDSSGEKDKVFMVPRGKVWLGEKP